MLQRKCAHYKRLVYACFFSQCLTRMWFFGIAWPVDLQKNISFDTAGSARFYHRYRLTRLQNITFCLSVKKNITNFIIYAGSLKLV